MKKNKKNVEEDDFLPEYDFTGGVRGKYAAKLAEEYGYIKLEPEVSKYFKKSNDVNRVLLAIINSFPVAGKNTPIYSGH